MRRLITFCNDWSASRRGGDEFVRDVHAEQISDLSDDLGTMIAGEFISPASTATSLDPPTAGLPARQWAGMAGRLAHHL